ncbi:unnamed protein product [Paramecium sonneborni]|uniref:RING-type domain-containing protein n=1 Tax=Paramecium sonneborni TaxID=65129 RepID=A0A8S1KKG4_9CILI|nr:unnamed protein product [Paramecium sonneborni]
MQNPSILNLQQVKQFQVRRPQITKGSPLLKGNQVQIAANNRNQSLLSDQPQHLKIKQQEEQELSIHNQFERRIQKQNQFDIKQQDNIFQLKLNNDHQLNQLNMQLIKKNKILSTRLQQQYKINELNMEQINKLQETNQAYELQIHQLEEKIKKQKSKKKQLKEQIDQLQQELDEMQEKYQNHSNQDMNQEGEQQQQQNHIPLTRQQLYQLMQYLYQGDQQQMENFHEYQDQEIDPDAMTYEQLLELEEQIGNVPKGLTKQQIKQLPKRILNQDNIPEDKCSVCLFEFKEEEKVRELPCKHIYHSNCIKNWLQNNKQCPLCKTEIEIQINESDDQDNQYNQQDEQGDQDENQEGQDQQQSEIE